MERKNDSLGSLPLLLLLGLAILLRASLLELRPLSPDEGINGYLTDPIQGADGYHYNPELGHGPLPFRILWMMQHFFGRAVWALRVPSVIFGVLAVFECWQWRRLIGEKAAIFAGLVMAVSPTFVWVSRQAIPEPAFVFWLLLWLRGAVQLRLHRSRSAVFLFMSGLTGCLLTKETVVLHLFAMAAATPVLCRVSRSDVSSAVSGRSRFALAWIVAALLATWLLWWFYTAGGRHADGLVRWADGFRRWGQIGLEGEGHAKPWHYWWMLLARYETLLLLSLLILPALWRQGRPPVRFLILYSVAIWLCYSIIPYKTPWLLASLAAGLPLLAGVAFAECPGGRLGVLFRPAAALCIAIACLNSLRLNFWRHSDPREPHVYAASSPEIRRLMVAFRRHLARDADGHEVRGKVLHSNSHPVPWLLGDFPHVDYYGAGFAPSEFDSGFLLVEAGWIAEVERKLDISRYHRIPLRIHIEDDPGILLLRKEVFMEAPAAAVTRLAE